MSQQHADQAHADHCGRDHARQAQVGKVDASLEPGPATAKRQGHGFQLDDGVLSAQIAVADGHLVGFTLADRLHGTQVRLGEPFRILLKDGTILAAERLRLVHEPALAEQAPQPGAARVAAAVHGRSLEAEMASEDGHLRVRWSLVLLDGSNYIRQVLSITAAGTALPIAQVRLLDANLPDAHVTGWVHGSPVVAHDVFFGFEHPLSESRVRTSAAGESRATQWIDRDLPLAAGQSITYSEVYGVARTGQLRRDFLAYLERERAHPYRTFLHYNSWYDLGYFTPYDEAAALDRVNAFGRELVEKRGVRLDSYLFDDGWDDHHSLWKFNSGFPDGFRKVRQDAAKYQAAPGVWLSPWGGYSKPKQERIDFGRSAGYEVVADGYALSGPKYYGAFRDVCLEMMREYGVNQFKFDGTGNADSVFPGSQFDSDFSAAIHLIGDLRAANPSVFINLTTGTWPSPFWLMNADSIWRGGDDDNFAGVGPDRERWITYRDADTYRGIVQNGPLFPLNSLMLHGMIYAQHHKQLDKDPSHDFRNEVRSYFGTGTQLQEMYLTPSLLTSSDWDDLAEAAKWSRANADVLKDTHWVGGDPAWLEVYGWASWSPRKGILVLRNPSDRPQSLSVRLDQVFELPRGAAMRYVGSRPWRDSAAEPPILLRADELHTFPLKPFEVLTLEFLPR